LLRFVKLIFILMEKKLNPEVIIAIV
jgi:hypothetical protein